MELNQHFHNIIVTITAGATWSLVKVENDTAIRVYQNNIDNEGIELSKEIS